MALERNSGENGRLVRVPAGPAVLEGNLALPGEALGVVLFAHGSGSSRFSPRNRAVAKALLGARPGICHPEVADAPEPLWRRRERSDEGSALVG